MRSVPSMRACVALLATLACGLAAGCVSPARSVQLAPVASLNLEQALAGLAPTVDRAEAARCAELAFATSLRLAQEYRAVSPALLQNVLVNSHLRPRGLCFQWADDLAAALTEPGFKTLRIRRVVAFLGKAREHSAIVVTAHDQPFEQGILLDAWRQSGLLFWCPIKEDRHPWIEVELIPQAVPPEPSRSN